MSIISILAGYYFSTYTINKDYYIIPQHSIELSRTINNISKFGNNKSNEKTLIKTINSENKEMIVNKEISNSNNKLKGVKDNLFKYQGGILSEKYNGEYNIIDYSEKRDIEDRDIIDIKQVSEKYINRKVSDFRREKNISINNKLIKFWEVKDNNIKNKDIKYIVFYFHGMGGSRHQGINDITFGGNFNRIQDLMLKNNGIYISSDLSDFYGKGTYELNIIIDKYKKEYPNSKVILSGASSGGTLLWNILKTNIGVKNTDGIILMGSVTDYDYNKVLNKGIPIYISHGTRDKQISVRSKELFYNSIKQKYNNYPIKIEIFNGGVHGTPIRMTDWKNALEWILKSK